MRLDSTDATIVTAIHTDGALIFSEGFGTQDTLGHYDFYPNGGDSGLHSVLMFKH